MFPKSGSAAPSLISMNHSALTFCTNLALTFLYQVLSFPAGSRAVSMDSHTHVCGAAAKRGAPSHGGGQMGPETLRSHQCCCLGNGHFVPGKEQLESEQWPATVRGKFRLERASGNLFSNMLLIAGLFMRSEEVLFGLETTQPFMLQCWTEGTRKLLRPVSLSVSLLVHVLMSRATEQVTGGLGQLENRRSGSTPSKFNWFVCAHTTLFIDKHIVVFPWQQRYGNS